jgi:hypothetical protein
MNTTRRTFPSGPLQPSTYSVLVMARSEGFSEPYTSRFGFTSRSEAEDWGDRQVMEAYNQLFQTDERAWTDSSRVEYFYELIPETFAFVVTFSKQVGYETEYSWLTNPQTRFLFPDLDSAQYFVRKIFHDMLVRKIYYSYRGFGWEEQENEDVFLAEEIICRIQKIQIKDQGEAGYYASTGWIRDFNDSDSESYIYNGYSFEEDEYPPYQTFEVKEGEINFWQGATLFDLHPEVELFYEAIITSLDDGSTFISTGFLTFESAQTWAEDKVLELVRLNFPDEDPDDAIPQHMFAEIFPYESVSQSREAAILIRGAWEGEGQSFPPASQPETERGLIPVQAREGTAGDQTYDPATRLRARGEFDVDQTRPVSADEMEDLLDELRELGVDISSDDDLAGIGIHKDRKGLWLIGGAILASLLIRR